MGNTNTRESGTPYAQGHSRSASASSRYRGSTTDGRSSNPLIGGSSGNAANPGAGASSYTSRRDRERDRDRESEQRARNLEHALFGLGIVRDSASRDRTARSREEEREAREARKAERERERERERQRSLREESCDGGFLVTQGVYTGPQDYKDKVVRHMMLERKLSPFWKGLPDHEDDWTDAQLVAAVRGFPIPGPEAECPPETPPATPAAPPPGPAANASDSALHLSVPIGTRSRSHSYTSDSSGISGGAGAPSRSRSKTLSISPPSNPVQTASTTNPLETNIQGKYVDGRPIEAVLYKEAKECPICFLYYPPWMNRTRCCDYDICSECFVQIKRADPHLPEHEQLQANNGESLTNPDLLISEPACCPFCKEPDFGVVYTPPTFRRGLVYSDSLVPQYLGGTAPSFSPESSVPHSPSTPSTPSPPPFSPRRKAFASTAAEVVTTDQIRPDWSHKLQSARNQAARRAAAATALHNAAFLLQREPGAASGGSGPFTSRRLMRRGAIPGAHGSESPSPGGSGPGTPRLGAERAADALGVAGLGLLGIGNGGGSLRLGPGNIRPEETGTRRRSRMVDLEEIMLREAIRLSILEEEARKSKEEAEAKKKAEEERAKNGGAGAAGEGGEGNVSEGKGKTVDRSVPQHAGESSASVWAEEGSESDKRDRVSGDDDVARFAELALSFGGIIDDGSSSGSGVGTTEGEGKDVVLGVEAEAKERKEGGASKGADVGASSKAVEAGMVDGGGGGGGGGTVGGVV